MPLPCLAMLLQQLLQTLKGLIGCRGQLNRCVQGWVVQRKDSPTVKRNLCICLCETRFSRETVFLSAQEICVQVVPTGDTSERSGGCDSCLGRCHRQRVSCLNPDIWPRPDIVQSKVPLLHTAHIDGPPKIIPLLLFTVTSMSLSCKNHGNLSQDFVPRCFYFSLGKKMNNWTFLYFYKTFYYAWTRNGFLLAVQCCDI